VPGGKRRGGGCRGGYCGSQLWADYPWNINGSLIEVDTGQPFLADKSAAIDPHERSRRRSIDRRNNRRHVLLHVQGLIASDEHIESSFLGGLEQLSILQTSESSEGSRHRFMMFEVMPQRMGQVFVEEDFQAG
jgi:hypothetical protein